MGSKRPGWRWRALALAVIFGLPLVAAAQTPGQAPAALTADQVLQLETALAELNFDPGKIDGAIDERTRAAIRLYQDFAALPSDGLATPTLLAEVLSVARSFAEMRATRAAEAPPEAPETPLPETSLPGPALPEPVASGLGPEKARAEASPETAGPPEEPEVEPEAEAEAEAAEVTPEPPPPEPTPAPTPAPAPPLAKAGGFSIDSVISRLVETGPRGPSETPALAPAPAPKKAPAPAPGGSRDGYAAFRDAYEAGRVGDFERAAKGYTDAIDSKKLTLDQLGDAHFNRANAFYFLGRHDRSIDDYDAAIASQPALPGAYYNRGFAHEAMGERQRAIEDFRRARELGLQRLGVRAPDRPPPR